MSRFPALCLLLAAAGTLAAAPLSVTPVAHPSPDAKPLLGKQWHQSWNDRTAALAKAAAAGADIVFVGDSITQGWEAAGRAAWKQHFEPLGKCLNLGISGDRTEHVLWRLEAGGNLPAALRPQVFVVLIGTNNAGARKDTPQDIAAGVEAIVARLHRASPQSKIVLTAIFPRRSGPAEATGIVAATNPLLKALATQHGAVWFDINDALAPGGALPRDVFPDGLHLSPKGYAIWATKLAPVLRDLRR